MYGTQACLFDNNSYCEFENDVKMYGTQATSTPPACCGSFENDVKMYGTQANDLYVEIQP